MQKHSKVTTPHAADQYLAEAVVQFTKVYLPTLGSRALAGIVVLQINAIR